MTAARSEDGAVGELIQENSNSSGPCGGVGKIIEAELQKIFT
jgi:hypothetical protein